MKKILFISGIQIFPPESGGQLRSANFCRSLVELGNVVDIYSFTGRKEEYIRHKESSEKKVQNHLYEYVNRNFFLGMTQFIFYRLNLPPTWLTLLTNIFIPRELKLKIKECDSLIADFPYLYPISKYSNKLFRLNTHNSEFELYGHRFFTSRLVKKIELASFKQAQHVFFCNSMDQDKYASCMPDLLRKSSILPNGVELSSFKQNIELRKQVRLQLKISEDRKVFLFTGSQYAPNKEAFEFLLKWSSIHREEMDRLNVLIMIVGTVSQDLVDEMHFKVIGKVKNIFPYFSASDFGINPVICGSGTNVKMMEYLAAQLPLVTTVFGGRGLHLKNCQTCWYFERDKLLLVMNEVVLQKLDQRKTMAQKAYDENLDKIDMSRALKSLQFQWG